MAPLILSVKALEQKTFAINSSLGIKVAPLWATYAGPGYGGGTIKTGKIGGLTCGIGAGVAIVGSPFFGAFVHVLLIPFFGCFMWP
jgi:hypothetical protein